MSDFEFDHATANAPDVIDPALIREAKRGTRVDIAQIGFNPALGRLPTIETQTVSLNTVLDFVPSWTARRIPIKCIGLTLPEGMEFLPPKTDTTKSSDGVELKRIGPPKKDVNEAGGGEKPRKVTRIKPPLDCRCRIACFTCCSRHSNRGSPSRNSSCRSNRSAINTKASRGFSPVTRHCWRTRWDLAKRCRQSLPSGCCCEVVRHGGSFSSARSH